MEVPQACGSRIWSVIARYFDNRPYLEELVVIRGTTTIIAHLGDRIALDDRNTAALSALT
jgi:hypothetical protein